MDETRLAEISAHVAAVTAHSVPASQVVHHYVEDAEFLLLLVRQQAARIRALQTALTSLLEEHDYETEERLAPLLAAGTGKGAPVRNESPRTQHEAEPRG